MKKIIFPCLFALLLSSCWEEAEITVQNKVSNATLKRVSWDGYDIAHSLLPGEKSRTRIIIDEKIEFPKTSVVKFYMTRGGNQVYLETKATFTLNIDDKLLIVISDDTQVVNPILP